MKKIKVFYFYAPWDSFGFEKKNSFVEECKRLGLKYYCLDVETKEGLEASIKYGVRNVPTAVVLNNKKVVGVEKGNHIHEIIEKYC